MFESRHHELLPRAMFWRRQAVHAGFGLILVVGSLGLGVVGYHFSEGIPWLDALVNASMILFGEGPVTELHTSAGKWFASFYAMYSGVAFVTLVAVVFAPTIHRFMHKFHLEDEQEQEDDK